MPAAEGDVIKSQARPEIYLVEGGKRRWIPDAPTLQSRWTFEQVVILPQEEVDSIPLGEPLPSVLGARVWPEGSLVQGPNVHIYVIEDGLRRHIPDPETFSAMGFDWSRVMAISEVELNAIPLGRPLPHAQRLTVDFDNFLGAGHYMTTHAALLTSTGHINAQTRTRTITWFGGFRGAVVLAFGDANGDTIGQSEFHMFGVDGTVIGQSDRTDYWPEDIPVALAQRTTTITAFHTWQPKTLEQLVQRAVALAEPILETGKKFTALGIGGSKTSE
jgi:hypothetical protein